MPPRYAYWTIIAGGLPTAFRAAERDDILPTFKRLQEKHPDAELKYFARGRLWASQDEAKRAADERREGRTSQPPRPRDWRPGGSHQDPRQPFKDAKKARNVRWRKEKFERRQEGQGPADRKRDDRRPPRKGNRPPWRDIHPPREQERFGRDQRPPRENQRFGKEERPLPGKPRFDRDRRPPGKDQHFDRDRRPPGKNPRFGSNPHPPRDDRPPREKPHGDPLRREARPRFEKRFEKTFDKKGFGPPRGPGRGPGRPPGKPPGKPPRRRS